jgi:hypothetical protein
MESIVTEVVRTSDGKETKRDFGHGPPPGVNLMSRRGVMGSMAAQQVLSAGGKIEEAVEAARKARLGTPPEEPGQDDAGMDPELGMMIRYIHAMCRLTNSDFDELSPKGLLEVAMLCPHPVVSFEAWKQKMAEATGAE